VELRVKTYPGSILSFFFFLVLLTDELKLLLISLKFI
jgi:hypothetical protein